MTFDSTKIVGWAVADCDYQDTIPAGTTVAIVAEDPGDAEGCGASWTIRDNEGREAVVPRGSLVELPFCWDCGGAATHWWGLADEDGTVLSANGRGYMLPLCDKHDAGDDTYTETGVTPDQDELRPVVRKALRDDGVESSGKVAVAVRRKYRVTLQGDFDDFELAEVRHELEPLGYSFRAVPVQES